MTEPDRSRGLRLRPIQVCAATLAALTGAFLASRLGVYGTVIGAGVISALTTIGTEVYMRSLDRTKQAALRSTAKVKSRGALVNGAAIDGATDVPDQATAEVPQDPPGGPWRRLSLGSIRWPMVMVGSAAAFAIAMVAITGLEASTGARLSGGEGSTLGALVVPDRGVVDTDDETDGSGGSGGAEAPSTGVSPTPSPIPEDGAEPGTGPARGEGGQNTEDDPEPPAETDTPETPEPSEPAEPTEPPETTEPVEETTPADPGSN